MSIANDAAPISTANILELKALGEAIFAEWYPHHRPGDPIAADPPLHIQREADALALRHRMVAARKRGERAA